jgi:hypothetical protein
METLNASIENTIENGLIQSVLETTNLNWTVSKQPIQTVSGIDIPNRMAIVRNDNSAILGIFTDNYEPYQNETMLELLYKISKQSGLGIHKCGLFGQGEKTYIQLKSEEFNLPNDKIKTYFTAVNSFDGSTQFGFGSSSITISCMNTFMGVYKTLESKMKHTQSMHIKLDGILKQLDLMRLEEKQNFETIQKMNEVKIDDETKLLVTKLLFEIPLKDKFSFNELIENPEKRISTRKQNQIAAFQTDFLTETAQKGNNLWGLFSGMTRFTTHSMNKDTTEHKMFGSLGERERKVFNTLAEMVG